MISLEQALAVLIAVQALGSILSYFIFKREIRNGIKALFKEPVVSRAMGIMAGKSGEVRHDKAVVDRVAGQILSSPQAKLFKTLGKQVGIDVDKMVEEEGAGSVVEQLLAGAELLNIDIASILAGSLKSSPDSASSGESAYLPK